MIVCGWCASATEPGFCSQCGRDPASPWVQRNTEPPQAEGHDAGRPKLDRSQVTQKLRIALKELGPDATNEQLAEHLERDESTVRRWRKLAGI